MLEQENRVKLSNILNLVQKFSMSNTNSLKNLAKKQARQQNPS